MFKQLLLLASVVNVQANSITNCHHHGSTLFCINTAGIEGYVSPNPTGSVAPKSYTSCQEDGSNTVCSSGSDEVYFIVETDEAEESGSHDDHDHDDHDHDHSESATETVHTASASGDAAAVTGCHFHGATQYCVDVNGSEGYVSPGPSNTANAPSSYTGCHTHGATETYCLDGSAEVRFIVEDEEEEDDHDHDHDHSASETHSGSESETSVSAAATSSALESQSSSSSAQTLSSVAGQSEDGAATLQQTGLLSLMALCVALLG